MNKNQHGSRKRKSCLSQLLEHHEEILKMLENSAWFIIIKIQNVWFFFTITITNKLGLTKKGKYEYKYNWFEWKLQIKKANTNMYTNIWSGIHKYKCKYECSSHTDSSDNMVLSG